MERPARESDGLDIPANHYPHGDTKKTDGPSGLLANKHRIDLASAALRKSTLKELTVAVSP